MVVVCVGGACMHVCMWCMAVACDGSGCVHMHGGDGPYEFQWLQWVWDTVIKQMAVLNNYG